MAVKKKKDFSKPSEVQSAASAFMSIPKAEFKDEKQIPKEEELDFITNQWEAIPPNGNNESTTKVPTRDTTNLSGNTERVLWNKSLSESKKNFQYTLSERQQEEFKSAALMRGYTRNGKIGKEANASKFLQDLIDCNAWEALEFINETELWDTFQNRRQKS
jgi:hypothetical protein